MDGRSPVTGGVLIQRDGEERREGREGGKDGGEGYLPTRLVDRDNGKVGCGRRVVGGGGIGLPFCPVLESPHNLYNKRMR